MPLTQFEVIDISGDVGIRAFGRSLEEVFMNAAMGMYSLITDTEGIKKKRHIDIEVKSTSLEGLLVAWLNELIFQFDTYGFVGMDVEIRKLSEDMIMAFVWGEDFDEERHERRLLLKAATYHQIKLERENEIWKAEVIFDI